MNKLLLTIIVATATPTPVVSPVPTIDTVAVQESVDLIEGLMDDIQIELDNINGALTAESK